jgi:hypothetical protein
LKSNMADGLQKAALSVMIMIDNHFQLDRKGEAVCLKPNR